MTRMTIVIVINFLNTSVGIYSKDARDCTFIVVLYVIHICFYDLYGGMSSISVLFYSNFMEIDMWTNAKRERERESLSSFECIVYAK